MSLPDSNDIKRSESMDKKGKIVESDLQEHGSSKNIFWKRNGSVSEATTSTSEKDIGTSKNRSQPVKSRQTQSGPLVPGAVIGHSLSERVRSSERYIVFFYYLLN